MTALFLTLALQLGLAHAGFPDPWLGAEELDVVVISRGERVDLGLSRVPGKFTIVDFGAAWCSPCHDAALQLKPYLAAHPDVVVRAVTLDAEPWELREQPVVEQHMRWVRGIPYFVVYSPSGRRIYRGNRVERVLRVIERRR